MSALFLNALVWAGFTFYGKTLLQTYRPFPAIACIQVAGTLLLLPFAFIATPVTPEPLFRQLGHLSWSTWAGALYLAAPCSLFAYHMWFRGVEALGPVKTSVFTYLNPLFALAAAVLLLHESLTALTLLGGGPVLLTTTDPTCPWSAWQVRPPSGP